MRKSHACWLSGWNRGENTESDSGFETMLTISAIKDSNLNILPVGCYIMRYM